jgi:threonine/homoserine/homoserine lactone efflux protein
MIGQWAILFTTGDPMLPDFPHLIFFLTATLLLNLIPGSDVLYIASQSLQSHKNGLLAALGISIGVCFYVIATAFGLTFILLKSPLLFHCIKAAGAIYIIYIAWQISRSPFGEIGTIKKTGMSSAKAFSRGIINTLLNPKVGIFFITFLPQFIDPNKGKTWLQLLSLGICFIISGTIVNLGYAFSFSKAKEKLFSNPFIKKWLHKILAVILGVIGVVVLFT